MNSKSEHIQQVLYLLGSPEMVNNRHETAIRAFISDFPYVQPAYYLLAKATKGLDTHPEDLALAATYSPNGEMLYRTIHQTYTFQKEANKALFDDLLTQLRTEKPKITASNTAEIHPEEIHQNPENTENEETPKNILAEPITENILPESIGNLNPEIGIIEHENPIPQPENIENEEIQENILAEPITENILPESIGNLNPEIGIIEHENPIPQPENIENEETPKNILAEPITENILPESIGNLNPEIGIIEHENSISQPENSEEEIQENILAEPISENPISQVEPENITPSPRVENIYIETFDHFDSVYIDNFAPVSALPPTLEDAPLATNLLSKEMEHETEMEHPQEVENTPIAANNQNVAPETENKASEIETPAGNSPAIIPQENTESKSNISKYDDDQLPYSFLWWLQKTRKEHYENNRPFAAQSTENKPTTPTLMDINPLENQYKEHIFHLQTPFNIEDHLADSPKHKMPTATDEIIENFIIKEPQISAPKSNKLDNDNKARQSATDSSEMVSETLAKIYVEQMLYDKAIATYKKLSLKFPEKNRYFADLISQLERKIS